MPYKIETTCTELYRKLYIFLKILAMFMSCFLFSPVWLEKQPKYKREMDLNIFLWGKKSSASSLDQYL